MFITTNDGKKIKAAEVISISEAVDSAEVRLIDGSEHYVKGTVESVAAEVEQIVGRHDREREASWAEIKAVTGAIVAGMSREAARPAVTAAPTHEEMMAAIMQSAKQAQPASSQSPVTAAPSREEIERIQQTRQAEYEASQQSQSSTPAAAASSQPAEPAQQQQTNPAA